MSIDESDNDSSFKPLGRVGAIQRTRMLPMSRKTGRSKLDRGVWVELTPQAVSIGSAFGRPVLVLKHERSGEVLPVWMQPLDAGLAIAELSQEAGSVSHHVTRRLFSLLGVKVLSCRFDDLVGHHQFAELEIETREGLLKIRARMDEAMSFCLQAKARFYAKRAYMARCRELNLDLAKLEYNLDEGLLPELQEELENSSMKHPYVM